MSKASSPAFSMSSCEEDEDINTDADLFSSAYFDSTVTLPIPYGRDVVSHPLRACRKSRASDRARSSFFFNVVMQTVSLEVNMYSS